MRIRCLQLCRTKILRFQGKIRRRITERFIKRARVDRNAGFFAQKNSGDFANKTIEAIAAYHDVMQKRKRNNFDEDYNQAFETIDNAIKSIANKVFYIYGTDSFDKAYDSFRNYNYVQTVRNQLHKNKK